MSGRAQGHKFARCIGWAMACLMAGLAFAASAVAEPVTTVVNNGSPANRVDIVILGDGYQAGELAKFAQDAAAFVNAFFARAPFDSYRPYFNVHRVDVVSNESGADHPEISSFVDTAFDATYNCASIQRLICVNVTKVYQVLDSSVNANQRDIMFVLVNDTEYGGSGGPVAVASINELAGEIAIHEIGHSFGLLADEYVDAALCVSGSEPSEPNATREISRAAIKWNVGGGPPQGWIDPATPIPTSTTATNVPGLYEGARYCAAGLYRPTNNSQMRTLQRPFGQINEEQFVKRIYNYVSPLDNSSPAGSSVSMGGRSSLNFTVTPMMPAGHQLQVTWRLDGVTVGSGPAFTLTKAALAPGAHSLTAELHDLTVKVRYDPTTLLTETRSWQVRSINPVPFLLLLLED